MVEARIAEALLPLTALHRVGSAVLPPHSYVRRHLVEHAAAGGVRADRVLSEAFLPFVDATRLRPLEAAPAGTERAAALRRAWRHAAHRWRWDAVEANADALAFRMTGLGYPHNQLDLSTKWATAWAQLDLGDGAPRPATPADPYPDHGHQVGNSVSNFPKIMSGTGPESRGGSDYPCNSALGRARLRTAAD